MKVLALDLSTKSAGWAIFDGKKLIDYGCITASNTNTLTRISTIVEELKVIHNKHLPHEIIVEEVLPEEVGHNNSVYKALIYFKTPKSSLEIILAGIRVKVSRVNSIKDVQNCCVI